MALINCPECGKEISDKSEKCIHCGFPIRNIPYIHENIMGKDYDISFLLDSSVTQAKQIKQLVELTGCDLFTAKEIVLKYHPTIKTEPNIPHCPHCNSTKISKIGIGERIGSIAILGVFSKKINKSFKCKNCGYTW